MKYRLGKWRVWWTGWSCRFKGLWSLAESPAGDQSLSEYPQGLILEWIQFNICINPLDDGTEHDLGKPAGNTERGGIAATLDGCVATHKGPSHDGEMGWQDYCENKKKFLYLRRNNPKQQYRSGSKWLESGFVENRAWQRESSKGP